MNQPAEKLPVRNPRTGQVDHWIQPPTDAELQALCTRLRAGQKRWGARPLDERLAILRRWADSITARAQAIGDAEAVDTGRQRLSHEVPHMVAAGVRGWCDRAPGVIERNRPAGTSTIYPDVRFQTQLVPLPLLGVISPWNHPFLLATLDAIPALVAGSAAVIKPSEITPRFVAPVMDSVRDVPELAEVLAFIVGDGRVGQQLIAQVDALCFTGSVRTGRLVAQACAARFIPAFLELGGKDAAIVTGSADLERAATAVLRSSVFATGQICFSTERVYVHASVHDRFVELLARKSDELALAYPDPHQGHLGPFIFERQAAIVDAHLDEAVAKGARIVTGGKSQVLGGGHYMPATVVSGVTHDMKLMTEETFGPVTPVMAYRTEEEAVALANDSQYGLSAAVLAGDEQEALRIGAQLDAGGVALQDAGITIAILRDAEKTSFNLSGLGGSRMGDNGLMRFFRKKALMVNDGPPADMRSLAEG